MVVVAVVGEGDGGSGDHGLVMLTVMIVMVIVISGVSRRGRDFDRLYVCSFYPVLYQNVLKVDILKHRKIMKG